LRATPGATRQTADRSNGGRHAATSRVTASFVFLGRTHKKENQNEHAKKQYKSDKWPAANRCCIGCWRRRTRQ